MTAALTLGMAWALLVAHIVIRRKPPTRVARLASGDPTSSDPAAPHLAANEPASPDLAANEPASPHLVSGDPTTAPARRSRVAPGRRATKPDDRSPVAWLGATLRRLAGRPDDPVADRRIGWALVAAAVLAWAASPLSPLPLAAAWVLPRLADRRATHAHETAVVDQLPDVVDLLTLTTSAGLPVPAAFGAIADRPGGPLGAALATAAGHIGRGGTTAEALTLVSRAAGPAVRPLVDALAEHTRYGTPLSPSLDRVAIEARLRRRRRAEEAARRLPVTLLFPLVLTTLPAFVLLTVVPLLAGSFSSLSP